MFIQDSAVLSRKIVEYIDNPALLNLHVLPGGNILWIPLWDDDQMSMRNAIAVYNVADSFGLKDLQCFPPDALCNDQHMCSEVIVNVGKVVNVRFRDDKRFTGSCGFQRHKCH